MSITGKWINYIHVKEYQSAIEKNELLIYNKKNYIKFKISVLKEISKNKSAWAL